MSEGCVHIYCGEGKGKTTAALGLLLRASGAGLKVIFVQFFKTWQTSELAAIQKLEGVTVLRGALPKGFTWDWSAEQRQSAYDEHNRLFTEAVSLCGDGENTLLICDELVGAFSNGFVDKDMVLTFLHCKPAALEFVMTGRNPDPSLIALADYVSEVKKIKHPMDRGLEARKGIEF